MKLGRVESKSPKDSNNQLTMVLWGESGCGKTTLASTAPGRKAWLQFDPNATVPISNRDDIEVLDFTEQPPSVLADFSKQDSLLMKDFERELSKSDVSTIVFDSTTTFADQVFTHAVAEAKKTAVKEDIRIEAPGMRGWGYVNTYVMRTLSNMHNITRRFGKHLIIIVHEGNPDKDSQGAVVSVPMLLGSNMPKKLAVPYSEIWWMDNDFNIAIRPFRQRSPMKSRMFSGMEKTFKWNYNPETLEGDGIATWYQQWIDGSKVKIPLPGGKK